MSEQDKRRMKQSLFEAIEKWCDSVAEDSQIYWGEKTTGLMADAAFAVVEGVADIQDYLERNGMTKAA